MSAPPAVQAKGANRTGLAGYMLDLGDCVGLWMPGSVGGTTTPDFSPSSLDGTYSGTVTRGQPSQIARTSIGSMDTAGGFVSMNGSLGFTRGLPHTLVWIGRALTNAAANKYIFSKMATSGAFTGWALFTHSTGISSFAYILRTTQGVGNRIIVRATNATILATDSDEHVWAASYDGSGAAAGVVLSRDGVALAMTTVDDALGLQEVTTAAPLNIATRNGVSGDAFNGRFTACAGYGRILSLAELEAMSEIFRNGS